MGDYYQNIVDLDADLQSAEALAGRIRDWMISQEIIRAEQTDCVLGAPLGYPPGKNYVLAVESPSQWLFETHFNGVEFIAEHHIFYAAGIGDITLVCAACGARFPSNDGWSAALDDWYEANGRGMLPCERCDAEAPLAEWEHDPPWGFGNVGIEFWNWPQLSESFLKKVSEILEHRVRIVYGKL